MKTRFTSYPLLALGLLATLSMASAPARADQTITESLDWTPFSTSYLPASQGPLTHTPGLGMQQYAPQIVELVNPTLVQSSTETVAARLDQMRARALGLTDPLTPTLEAMYRSDAQGWEGFCHQWSAAANDRTIARLLESASDLVCGGTFLSVSELRELVTAFYPSEEEEFVGTRYDQALASDMENARSTTGLDSLPAHTFQNKLLSTLAANHGVVASLAPPPQVWNFPVVATQIKLSAVSARDIGNLPELPSYVFSGTSSALQSYASTESTIANLVQGNQSGGNLDSLVSARAAAWRQITQQVKAGTLQLNPAYQIQKASNLVQFAVEAQFATSSGGLIQSRTLEYVLVRKAGESQPSDSRWITEPDQRPAFMWLPRAVDLSSTPGLRDVVKLIKTCTTAGDIQSFFTELSNSRGRPNAKTVQDFAKLKDILNRSMVNQYGGSSL